MATDEKNRSPELDIFRPELHAFVYKAIIEEADQAIGPSAVDALFAEYHLKRNQLLDPEAWVSLAFTEAFLDDLYREAKDPQIYGRVGRLVMSPRYLGPRYAFIRAFQSPMSTFMLVAKTVGTMNKTGTYMAERTGRSSCVLTFIPVEGIGPEKTPHMCRLRAVTIANVPSLFDLPPAKLEHPSCIAEGDAVCTYRLSWAEPRGRGLSWLIAALGGSAGALYASTHALDPLTATLCTLIPAAYGWTIGNVYRLRGELSARTRYVTEQQEALETSLRTNERRFQELLQAKAEVDRRVEQRTSELRQATQRLSETLNEIQALDKAKTDFFNNVSHDLRSPLTLILAPLDDLIEGRVPPGGQRSAFETMHRNATRLLRLINQLLDLAKIDAGEVKTALSPTNVMDLVRSVSANFEIAARTKHVSLEIHGVENVILPLDTSWIESAVTNLVANAIRVAQTAVRITVEDHGAEVTLAVSDDGPGIALEDQQRVFSRFAQGDSKRSIGGTGIGLALVREATRLHGGEVQVISELGLGATFTLTLPRVPGFQPQLRGSDVVIVSNRLGRTVVEELRHDATESERSGPGPAAPLAFVVEDNPELCDFIADVLAVRYRVRTFGKGRRALESAAELRPDIVVSDVAMPEMDGYELSRALRKLPETQTTPIVLVTARTEVASVLEGFGAGANDYVLKPFHGRELLARVDVHVKLRRMTQELALRERRAILGVLAASVAHQVRNPLTTLVSGLPAMRGRLEGKVNQGTFDLIDIMLDCAGRIERLTRDLMDLSRVDREEGGLYKPSEGLRAAVRLVRTRVSSAVEIKEHIEDSPMTEGRSGDMNHVFLNLLDNALRAVVPEGQIKIEAFAYAGEYLVRIGDSGPGIDARTADRVFEPFFTTRAAGEGTGLGLAIAKQVLLECGGQIVLGRSTLGGAEFSIHIPIVQRTSSRPPAELGDTVVCEP